MPQQQVTPTYSVIIPLKDEAENISDLIGELEPVMEELQKPWELICIDDGSTDGTLGILEKLACGKPYLRTISFTRNFGQSSAFDAGFKAARGKIAITMDGDRQNDPKDIPRLLEELDGYALVCGRRLKRRDSIVKRCLSVVANAVRSRVCCDGMHDTGCSLKVYDTRALQTIKMYEGMHRFLPALFTIEGFPTKEVVVNHRERANGRTKYTLFNRSLNTIADLFVVWWMRRRHLHYDIRREVP